MAANGAVVWPANWRHMPHVGTMEACTCRMVVRHNRSTWQQAVDGDRWWVIAWTLGSVCEPHKYTQQKALH